MHAVADWLTSKISEKNFTGSANLLQHLDLWDRCLISGQHTQASEQELPIVPKSSAKLGIVPQDRLNDSESNEPSSKGKRRASEKLQAAAKDSFLKTISATSGPAAFYKENRLSGAYKKVTLHW